MREADRHAIVDLGIPELILMEHAAMAVLNRLHARFGALLPETRGVIVAGSGNNGGDALAVARLASSAGCNRLFVALPFGDESLSPSAVLQLSILGKLGIAWSRAVTPELLGAADWIVDGLFGTGLSRPVEGAAREAISHINACYGEKWIVSIDIPSGLSADTGLPLGIAVRASETVTLGFLKKGLVTGAAADHVGHLTLDPIQIPRAIPGTEPTAFLYGAEDAARFVPERLPTSHKGTFGHVFVFAGPPAKQGAAALAGLGALRAGAGLVTVVGEPATLDSLRPRLPIDLMTAAYHSGLFAEKGGRVGVIGPGMGTDKAAADTLLAALASDWPLVIDADATTLISEHATLAKALAARGPQRTSVLTPHPKEAARLLGLSLEAVQADRYSACQHLADEFDAQVLLKGKGTLLGGPGLPVFVVDAGNTALAVGGTGDLLAGILAALLAQGIRPAKALPFGAWLHGRASEIYTQRFSSEHSSMASEIASVIPEVFRELPAFQIRPEGS